VIFVTVGMHSRGFDRLARAADEMAARIDEPVVIQRGSSRFTPSYAQWFDFLDQAEMQQWLADARVVASHGGAGSILSVLLSGKPLVVVPRLRRFGEARDDHQLELARALAQRGIAVNLCAPSSESLLRAVEEAVLLTRVVAMDGGLQGALGNWLGLQGGKPVDALLRCRPKKG
jgi:beta-1,4-N-acetylglucosaminyltransferase